MKILVVDDDEAILDAIKIILEDYKYDVALLSDGITVSKVTSFHPDLILLDVWLSGEDGRVICKKLKRNTNTKEIPIILISATQDLPRTAAASGADDYLEKPFQMAELLRKVKENLRDTAVSYRRQTAAGSKPAT